MNLSKNKMIKAAAATIVAGALLLTAGGTFASWSSVATVSSDTITAGSLRIADGGLGTWYNSADEVIDINSYHISPGEFISYKKTLRLTTTGKELRAKLSLDGQPVITAASPGTPEDDALAAYVMRAASLVAIGPGIVNTGPGSIYTVTAGESGITQDVTVIVSIIFPNASEGAENNTMGGAVRFNDLTVSLVQQ